METHLKLEMTRDQFKPRHLTQMLLKITKKTALLRLNLSPQKKRGVKVRKNKLNWSRMNLSRLLIKEKTQKNMILFNFLQAIIKIRLAAATPQFKIQNPQENFQSSEALLSIQELFHPSINHLKLLLEKKMNRYMSSLQKWKQVRKRI